MLKKFLTGYSNDVLSGKIVACQKHKWACQRFLKDLEREGTKEFPYLFNEQKGERFLNWMRLFKHRKGVLAGKHKEPAPIEKFIFGNIYGWYHRDTGYRRFKKSYWQVGRKNSKSQDEAIVATYEASAFGVESAEIYVAATKKDQARIVWEEADWIIKHCEELKEKFNTAYSTITHLKSGSVIKALSKEDQKTGDGLNPQCGILDEYHAHDTTEIYDIMDSGMVARPQPLMKIITTAGFDLSKPCYRTEYIYVSQILDPDNPVEDDTYFVMICELDKDDDIKDEKMWVKANPIVCSYPEGRQNLRDKLREALEVPEKMRNFLTKNMNIWVDQKDKGYMALDKWKACGTDNMPDLSNLDCYIGIDLSSKIDLTSAGFEIKLPNGRFAVLSHSFMPEDTMQAKIKTDKIPYDLWARQGWITATPGSVVDYRFITEYIKKQQGKYGFSIREICFDPYNATQFATELQDEGYFCVEIRQGTKTLSEPTKSFREEVYSTNIVHDNNPVLAWAIGNAVIRQDHNENIMLDKDKSSQRIDPISAVINAHVRTYVTPVDGEAWATNW